MTEKPIVQAERMPRDPARLQEAFARSIRLLGMDSAFNRARAIFIKPNLTYPDYKQGVTTRVEFVRSLVAALREVNGSTLIYIGEGEGGYNSFSMTEAMARMGFPGLTEDFPGVRIVNLSEVPARRIELRAGGKSYPLSLPGLFFDEIDFSLTCPVPKVHCMTGITLALKNQWGCLPDIMRLKNHYVFDEIIGQINQALKFRYAFLDGLFGLDRNGPLLGDAVELGWYAASNSLGAFDMIVSEMMGFDWKEIGHLRMAAGYGLVPERTSIEVIGDIQSLARKLTLKRTFWNYPALAAFHSRPLTQLFYFSGWAKPLHDLMYLFRTRPIG